MRLLRLFTNILLSVLLILVISVLMLLSCSKTLISKENISKYVQDADILNTDINVLFNKEPSNITLKDKVIDLALQNEIPQEIVDDILKSKEINQLLGDFFNQLITYIIRGTNRPNILPETIEDMKFIAHESLNNHINIMIEEEQLDIYIINYCKSIVSLTPERNEVVGNLPIKTIENIISFNVWYLYVVIALIILLLSIVNRSLYKSLKYVGLSMLTSGIIFVIVGSMDYIISNYILNQLTIMKSFISPIITNFLTICFKTGVLVSFSSIILVLCYLTINAIVKE